MAQQIIDLGSAPNVGGDTIRAGGTKINDNFTELYARLGGPNAVVTWIAGTAETWSLPGTVGAVEAFYASQEPIYITTFTPSNYLITFHHTAGGGTAQCQIGFEYSYDGITWITGVLVDIDVADLGVKSETGAIAFTNPIWVRPVFTNSSGAENAGLAQWTLTLYIPVASGSSTISTQRWTASDGSIWDLTQTRVGDTIEATNTYVSGP